MGVNPEMVDKSIQPGTKAVAHFEAINLPIQYGAVLDCHLCFPPSLPAGIESPVVSLLDFDRFLGGHFPAQRDSYAR